MSKKSNITYLKNYTKPDFSITKTSLRFYIYDSYVLLKNQMLFKKEPHSQNAFLQLDGFDIHLESISIDNKKLFSKEYKITKDSLIIPITKNTFTVLIESKIYPDKNTSLEGLYLSQGLLCTQCEPSGFRNITYFLDRPDILTTYLVRIEADKTKYPVLLSNGNLDDSGDLGDNRHWVLYSDPFFKPSYLFALVAGKLSCLKSFYKSKSNRSIELQIYATKEQIKKCEFAMESLKKAMSWDEKVYNLECDLDTYKIVAISDFNMGGMENKGLNVFNSALILADPKTTTDHYYQSIESVVAHEYFHNWTGNRVTCRDWFQLCLKEGLTVFRDQEFSKTTQDPDYFRIQEVRMLMERQIPEDTGPLAHPPRPNQFIEINNLYTATVYEKGAECVRMLESIVGKELFIKGVQLYLKKFDGMAVTQEDFIKVFEDLSQKDLSQFMLWYTEPGIPLISYENFYNKKEKTYSLTIEQKIKKIPNYENTKARHIPISLGFFQPENDDREKSYVVELKDKKQTFVFENIQTKPIPSLFRSFSAPVKVVTEMSDSDALYLVQHESDAFSCWKIFQDYLSKQILKLIKKENSNSFDDAFLSTFRSILFDQKKTPAVKAAILETPSYEILLEHCSTMTPSLLIKARNFFRNFIAKSLEQELYSMYHKFQQETADTESILPEYIGKRSFKNMCLGYLTHSETDAGENLLMLQFENAANMSDKYFAFVKLCRLHNSSFRKKAIYDFYALYENEELVVDMWFLAQASSCSAGEIKALLTHPKFNFKNPNRVRSLLGAFFKSFEGFHDKEGSGYSLCKSMCEKIDELNPQVAAYLGKFLVGWKKFDKKTQDLMLSKLQDLKQSALSKDLSEIVEKGLI